MKLLTLILLLLILCPVMGQEIPLTKAQKENGEAMQVKNLASDEAVSYSLDKEEFRFTPEENGYKITKMENGKEIDYGTLSQTTDDGYYIMTSEISEQVCYGRFDDLGNFRALTYDEKSDAIIEQNFILASK